MWREEEVMQKRTQRRARRITKKNKKKEYNTIEKRGNHSKRITNKNPFNLVNKQNDNNRTGW